MRIVYFGSGAFGLPTLNVLADTHEVALVVTQPDRPAGRDRQLAPTPVAELARRRGLSVLQPENVNVWSAIDAIRRFAADAFVVIAFGQKLAPDLLGDTFAINLHASLLPKYRGAAPINWAIINGETATGLSVITLADRMDAGDILGQSITPVDPMETAGELHDRLAKLGPRLVSEVLDRKRTGTLTSQPQDDSKATRAPKLAKSDGTVTFDQPAVSVRNRVHGLTPWPGCRVRLGLIDLRLHRVAAENAENASALPGTILPEGRVACAVGVVKLLAVQSAGGRLMSFDAYRTGHTFPETARLMPMDSQP